MSDPGPLRIECVHDARLCYAMQQNAVPLVPLLRLCNDGDAALADLEVRVSLRPDLAPEWRARVAAIPAGAVHELTEVRLQPRPDALANATERQLATLCVEVTAGGAPCAAVERDIEVLAYNEWPGAGSQPSLLAAFVLPNHPSVAAVLRGAASRLAGASGRAALDGYQQGDPGRALLQAQAIYDELQARGLVYVHPPASFEQQGQKVRTPEQVLHDGMGTCLDLALLAAACLEQAGLHPLLIVVEGHALCGVWLADEVFAEAAPADPLPLRKRVELLRIALFECTTLCSTQVQPFAAACDLGARSVAADARFLYAVDVTMARRQGVRPLPVRTAAFAADGAAAPPPGQQPSLAPPAPVASEPPPPAPVPAPPPVDDGDRLARWQRRLLDLTLRNRLLNFRASKRAIELQQANVAAWHGALLGGASFHVLPTAALAAAGEAVPAEERAEALAAFLQKELQSRRLHAALPQEELDRRLLEIWRQARTSHEESGVNTLFLALGFLRWYETPTSREPRRAPLLLVPLRIERLSQAEGFVLALADEEARLNETLVQKLHHDFGIAIPGLEALGDDADDGDGVGRGGDGPDPDHVLDAFRRAIVDVDRWEVEPVAWVGCFSFAKYLMWADLAERRRELLEHPLLQHLIESPERALAPDPDPWPRPEGIDALAADALLCPLDADSSQLCAVLAAAQGRTFVLEGPPGTGKSQTITNLIAQCLAQGQRVLFVAEKRAALEVVQRRLSGIGLAPFCLELHSGKGQKRSVVQQLGRALDLARVQEPGQWQQRAAELARLRGELNGHVDAVHRRRAAGCSVFSATATVVSARALPQVDGLPTDVDADGLQRRREHVAELAASAEPLGVLVEHPWYGVRRGDWHPALAREVQAQLPAVAATLAPARAAYAAAAARFGLPPGLAGGGRAPLQELAELAEVVCAGPLPPGLAAPDPDGTALALARRWIEQAVGCATSWRELDGRWDPALLDLDPASLLGKVLRHEQRFVLVRWWRMRPVRAALRAVARGPLPRGAALRADLGRAVDAARSRAELLACGDAPAAWFGAMWQGADSDPAALRAACDRAERALALAAALAPANAAPAPVGSAAVGSALLHRCVDLAGPAAATAGAELAALVERHAALRAALAQLAAPLQLCFDRAFGRDRDSGFLVHVETRLQQWAEEGAALREQCAFQRDAAAARALGLEPLEQALESGTVAAGQLAAVFERSFAESWLGAVLRQEPALQAFRGVDHERRIDRFRALDRELIELSAQVVLARLCAELPTLRTTGAESSELGVLLRELKKQRRHLAPRQLFARIPNLVPRLAPCLLMSPMTVAQVLGRRLPPFDVVVFDEASQVPVWDAVGAIGRGRSLVVVGDSRQLPPTQFFQRLDDDADDAVELERIEELESVLDECTAAGMQRLDLRWHYRSRHESLIAFSNHHYYDNRLLTFPSPDRGGALGVRLVPVDGVYDRARSQTNRIEAEALVKKLVARLRDPATTATYGVVTFSQPQQELVEDLLDRARREHPEIERHFGPIEEPVFVKNLENVQGDERDAMLFSICYGPDAAGKVHMNFGPLNAQGGERRLNVAVTRARRELLVFSSLRAEQIELQRTQSLGVRHLRAFLDYATRGERALVAAIDGPGGDCESPFERAVLQALRERGHDVHAQVGCSGYRIDLAVVDPRAPGRYLLGVECDGASYHAASTARDRDRLRQAVLERLGWRVFRIWSTDWWLDPGGELRRFDAAVAAALRAAPPAAPRPLAASVAAPAEVESAPEPDPVPADPAAAGNDAGVEGEGEGEGEYRPTALAPVAGATADLFHSARQAARVREQVALVLAAEAPIAFELLARRVAEAWGIGRTTERVRERVRAAVPAGAAWRGDFVHAPGSDPDAPAGFRGSPAGAAAREPDQLPPSEVEQAMAWVLRQHGSLAEDDLLRETARVFGFTRLGNAVRAAMQRGLDDLAGKARIDRSDGVVRPS